MSQNFPDSPALQNLLKFYYSFLLKFVGRENFEYLETDTDTSYVALVGKKL